MQYYRNNPDSPINHDWFAGARRIGPKMDKIDVSKFSNFDLKEIEIGETYQYKEGGIIFNFVLTSFKNDGKYVYLEGEVDDKTKQKYGLQKLEITLSVEPFYYSGMIHIMKKDSYLT